MAIDELSLTQNVATLDACDTRETSLQIESDADRLLRQAFGVEFHLIDVESGHIARRSHRQPINHNGNWVELCREVARRRRAEFIDEADPLLVLAVPLGKTPDSEAVENSLANGAHAQSDLVAVATFLSRPVDEAEDFSQAAELLGFDADDVTTWARRQTHWSPKLLSRAARQFSERLADRRQIERLNTTSQTDQRRIKKLTEETQTLTENLASTYEEIALRHRLTQTLKLSEGDQHLGQMALQWLDEVVPAEVLALVLLP
ncbi:MAG: hypothetical protein U9N87_02600, partial [Planctomycetota bacterium]|nr:hypothetical protein [Planctomycetota bacterium]